MMNRRIAAGLVVVSVLGALACMPRADAAGSPTVVELYTSQSRYSCPPAERLLDELAQRPDMLALEFHVDYWDQLVHGSAGKWRDPFSSRAHTDRQRDYNTKIRNPPAVYTPHMVIDGRLEAVGNRPSADESTLRLAKRTADPRIDVSIVPEADGGYTVSLMDGPEHRGGIWLISYCDTETTRVQRGENQGLTLVNHNIVTGMRRIGRWASAARSIDVGPIAAEPGTGCAILVQAKGPGPILGAAACPIRGS